MLESFELVPPCELSANHGLLRGFLGKAHLELPDRCILSVIFSVGSNPAMGHDPRCPTARPEARRKRACALKPPGRNPRERAEALAVSPAAASQWRAQVRQHGVAAGRATPRPSGPLTLTDAHLRVLPALLSQRAEADGGRGEGWACTRVATVIGEAFGVSCHKAHGSRRLKRVPWTPPRPSGRAARRHEAVTTRWRPQLWPELATRPA